MLLLLLLQVVAEANQLLQLKIAKVVAAGDSLSMSELIALRTDISKLAAVQQNDMSASIATLAAMFAADPRIDPSNALVDFQDVSGCLLCSTPCSCQILQLSGHVQQTPSPVCTTCQGVLLKDSKVCHVCLQAARTGAFHQGAGYQRPS